MAIVFISATIQQAHKMNGYSLRGNNPVIFIIAPYINGGHLIKERSFASVRANSLRLRVDPYFEGTASQAYKKGFEY